DPHRVLGPAIGRERPGGADQVPDQAEVAERRGRVHDAVEVGVPPDAVDPALDGAVEARHRSGGATTEGSGHRAARLPAPPGGPGAPGRPVVPGAGAAHEAGDGVSGARVGAGSSAPAAPACPTATGTPSPPPSASAARSSASRRAASGSPPKTGQ